MQVALALEQLSSSSVTEILPTVASLLDAGCNDFFRGSRGMVIASDGFGWPLTAATTFSVAW